MRIEKEVMQRLEAKLAILLTTVFCLIGLDQWLKASATIFQTHPKEWGWLKMVWHENPGIAFSIALTSPLAVSLVVILLLVLIGLWWRSRGQMTCYQWGLLLAIGGGASNLLDKLKFGFVRDFVSLWIFPVFNLADVFIFVGVVMIILGVIYGERHQKI